MKKTKKGRTPKKQEKKSKLLSSRIGALNQILKFRQFLGASFEPVISDAEIIVCFIDVRGFTDYCRLLQREMQDRKIQNFLRKYLKIFNEGLMTWYVENLDPEYSEPKKYIAEIGEYVVPKMYKNLGDGLMIVWEIPPHLSFAGQGNLAQQIVFAINEMMNRFYVHFRDLSPIALDSYSKEVLSLHLGCGIAKGHAWRLDYGHSLDYAGSIINLASRLESFARPQGIVAHYDVSTWMFNKFVANGKGHLVDIRNIKGYGTVRAWLSTRVDHVQQLFKPVKPAKV